MSQPVFKLEIEYINPTTIESEVPGSQKLREVDAIGKYTESTDDKIEVAPDGSDLSRVITVTKNEAVFTKGDLKLQKVTVTEDISPEDMTKGAFTALNPLYSEVLGSTIEGPHLMRTSPNMEEINGDNHKNEESKPVEVPKPRTKIPRQRFKQSAERVKQLIKYSEDRKDPEPSHIPRRSNNHKKAQAQETPKNNNETVEDDFDKIYDEIFDNNDSIDTEIDDPEKIESTFEEIIHAYDENKIQPINVEKIKSKIPLLKRKSLHDIEAPKTVDRRHSLKNVSAENVKLSVKADDVKKPVKSNVTNPVVAKKADKEKPKENVSKIPSKVEAKPSNIPKVEAKISNIPSKVEAKPSNIPSKVESKSSPEKVKPNEVKEIKPVVDVKKAEAPKAIKTSTIPTPAVRKLENKAEKPKIVDTIEKSELVNVPTPSNKPETASTEPKKENENVPVKNDTKTQDKTPETNDKDKLENTSSPQNNVPVEVKVQNTETDKKIDIEIIPPTPIIVRAPVFPETPIKPPRHSLQVNPAVSNENVPSANTNNVENKEPINVSAGIQIIDNLIGSRSENNTNKPPATEKLPTNNLKNETVNVNVNNTSLLRGNTPSENNIKVESQEPINISPDIQTINKIEDENINQKKEIESEVVIDLPVKDKDRKSVLRGKLSHIINRLDSDEPLVNEPKSLLRLNNEPKSLLSNNNIPKSPVTAKNEPKTPLKTSAEQKSPAQLHNVPKNTVNINLQPKTPTSVNNEPKSPLQNNIPKSPAKISDEPKSLPENKDAPKTPVNNINELKSPSVVSTTPKSPLENIVPKSPTKINDELKSPLQNKDVPKTPVDNELKTPPVVSNAPKSSVKINDEQKNPLQTADVPKSPISINNESSLLGVKEAKIPVENAPKSPINNEPKTLGTDNVLKSPTEVTKPELIVNNEAITEKVIELPVIIPMTPLPENDTPETVSTAQENKPLKEIDDKTLEKELAKAENKEIASLRGKVGRLINRINSSETPNEVEKPFKNEIPITKSIVSRLAAFERQDATNDIPKTRIPRSPIKAPRIKDEEDAPGKQDFKKLHDRDQNPRTPVNSPAVTAEVIPEIPNVNSNKKDEMENPFDFSKKPVVVEASKQLEKAVIVDAIEKADVKDKEIKKENIISKDLERKPIVTEPRIEFESKLPKEEEKIPERVNNLPKKSSVLSKIAMFERLEPKEPMLRNKPPYIGTRLPIFKMKETIQDKPRIVEEVHKISPVQSKVDLTDNDVKNQTLTEVPNKEAERKPETMTETAKSKLNLINNEVKNETATEIPNNTEKVIEENKKIISEPAQNKLDPVNNEVKEQTPTEIPMSKVIGENNGSVAESAQTKLDLTDNEIKDKTSAEEPTSTHKPIQENIEYVAEQVILPENLKEDVVIYEKLESRVIETKLKDDENKHDIPVTEVIDNFENKSHVIETELNANENTHDISVTKDIDDIENKTDLETEAIINLEDKKHFEETKAQTLAPKEIKEPSLTELVKNVERQRSQEVKDNQITKTQSEDNILERYDTTEHKSEKENKPKRFKSTQERHEMKRSQSLAELDLGDSIKGKVQAMILRINSIETLEMEKRQINIKERPRKRSVSEKIALFERKFSPVEMEDIKTKPRPPAKILTERTIQNVETKPVITQNTTKQTEKETVVDEKENLQKLNDKIQELNNAKIKYGRLTEMMYLTLKNDVEVPVIALGTALLNPKLIPSIISAAIDLGYRAFDTAFIYGNEKEVGEGIRAKIEDGTVKREDLFIMNKLWSTYHRTDLVAQACQESLKRLGLDYFDLFMIHNPMSMKEGGDPLPKIANVLQYSEHDYLDAWYGMEDVLKKGLAKSIGVSNFNSEQLKRIIEKGRVKPSVNQVECHPYLSQQRLDAFCDGYGIKLVCFGVLGSKGTPDDLKANQTPVIDDPLVQVMAAGLGVTPAQLLIRYQIDSGRAVVVKSSSGAHLWNNLEALKFKLTQTQVDALSALNKNKRTFTFKGMGDTHKNYPFKIPF